MLDFETVIIPNFGNDIFDYVPASPTGLHVQRTGFSFFLLKKLYQVKLNVRTHKLVKRQIFQFQNRVIEGNFFI